MIPAGVQVSEIQADLLSNDVATAQTVRRMCELIAESINDYGVMRCIQKALKLSDIGSRQRMAAACWDWCKRNIKFVHDDAQLWHDLGSRDELELLISPAVMARARSRKGDCDDFTMMLCAMLCSMGVPCVIKTFKCDRQDPERWAHVCAGVILEDGSLLPLDASHGDYPGWQVPERDIFASQLWDMNGNPIDGGSNGMGFARRGLGDYTSAPGWTGNPMSSTTGPEAGPYSPIIDIRKYYQGCNRAAGLGYIARRGRAGLGDVTVEGDYSTYVDPSLIPTGPDGIPVTQSPTFGGSSFDWNNFLGSLLGAGTKIGTAALGPQQAQVLPGGRVLLPSGQLVNTSSGISTGVIVAAVLGIGLLMALKK